MNIELATSSISLGVINDEELIILVEKFPQLWNKTEKAFKDKNAKENGWASVAEILNDSADQCEHRFSTLRHKYAAIKRKLRSTPSAAAAAELKATWELFPLMGFLDRFITSRRRHRNVAQVSQPAATTEITDNRQESSQFEEVYIDTAHTTSMADNSEMSPAYDPINQIIVGYNSSFQSSPSVSPNSNEDSLRTSMPKKRKLSADGVALTNLTKAATESMEGLKQYLATKTSQENDLENSFVSTIGVILKNIRGKKRRKRAMKEIISLAIGYDSGSDTE